MDLSKHVETVRNGIVNAAALADDNTQEVARRLGTAVDASARLALLDAISDATNEISADLAPGSVELRVTDGNPGFAVHLPEPSGEPTLILPQEPQVSEPEPAAPEPEPEHPEVDEPMVRVSLRLPASVKSKVDETADTEGISTNAWLVKAIQNALSPSIPPRTPEPPPAPTPPGAGIFGQDGPFGPNGVFGPQGVFGPGGVFGGKPASSGRNRRNNNVQGWVR